MPKYSAFYTYARLFHLRPPGLPGKTYHEQAPGHMTGGPAA